MTDRVEARARTAGLWYLLHDVDRRLTRLMIILAVSGVAIATVVTFHQIAPLAPLVLLSGADFLQPVPQPQRDALAYGFLRLARAGGELATAFWGLWLFPLGALPIVDGIAYVVVSLIGLAAPTYLGAVNRFAMPFYLVGEMATIGWLVVKGAAARPVAA
jgi:hypothetical protein